MNRCRIYRLHQALNLVSAFNSHHTPLVAIVVGVKVLTQWFYGWLIWSYLHGGADWITCNHRKLQMTALPHHCAVWTTFCPAWTQAKPLYLPKYISQCAHTGSLPLNLRVLVRLAIRLVILPPDCGNIRHHPNQYVTKITYIDYIHWISASMIWKRIFEYRFVCNVRMLKIAKIDY